MSWTMKIWVVLPFFVSIEASAGQCILTPDKLSEFLAMNYQEFDQTQGKGFREFEDKNCYLEAALAIDAWRSHKESSLEDWQKKVSYFHAGQAYASVASSLYPTAISHFEKSTNPSEPVDQELKWNAYVGATIAFLKKDKNDLVLKRSAIAVSSSSFNLQNLRVVDRLIKCIDRPYLEAYTPGRACGP